MILDRTSPHKEIKLSKYSDNLVELSKLSDSDCNYDSYLDNYSFTGVLELLDRIFGLVVIAGKIRILLKD